MAVRTRRRFAVLVVASPRVALSAVLLNCSGNKSSNWKRPTKATGRYTSRKPRRECECHPGIELSCVRKPMLLLIRRRGN